MNKRQRVRRFQWAVGKVQKRLGKWRFPCLYPGCNRLAISSHSQQKEGQLRAIAKDDLVYAFKSKAVFHMKQLIAEEPWSPLMRIGIAEASTFWGYCADHDRDLFAPIERKPLVPDDPEQASLLFLRAISFEYAAKRKAFIQLRMFAEAMGDDADPQWHEYNAAFTEGIKLFLEREGPFLLSQIFDVISKSNYDLLHTAWVRVHQTLPISVITSICPWLNDYQDKWSPTKPQAMVSFSVIPAANYTDVVSSWLDYCHNDAKWIQKEMETFDGTQRMVNLLGIAESEDFCIDICFWESLPGNLKELILSNMQHDLFRGSLSTAPVIIKLEKIEPAVASDRPKGKPFANTHDERKGAK
jgi:hypothetical protein